MAELLVSRTLLGSGSEVRQRCESKLQYSQVWWSGPSAQNSSELTVLQRQRVEARSGSLTCMHMLYPDPLDSSLWPHPFGQACRAKVA